MFQLGDVSTEVDKHMKWLWNNSYYSFVALLTLLANKAVRDSVLGVLPLPTLHACGGACTELRRWVRGYIAAAPITVIAGGTDGDWYAYICPLPVAWDYTGSHLANHGIVWGRSYATRPLVYSYAPGQDACWFWTHPLKFPRAPCAGASLSDRRVVVVGGMLNEHNAEDTAPTTRAEVLNPWTMTWQDFPPAQLARFRSAACTLNAAATRIMVTGGCGAQQAANSAGSVEVEVYDQDTGR